ncbi:hypothetical protein HZS_5449 [Henneguya salminicola]|nr:hypothetical protein HZS_5449 [Henneguya salminicola]
MSDTKKTSPLFSGGLISYENSTDSHSEANHTISSADSITTENQKLSPIDEIFSNEPSLTSNISVLSKIDKIISEAKIECVQTEAKTLVIQVQEKVASLVRQKNEQNIDFAQCINNRKTFRNPRYIN